jgi:hypothetical protein
MKSILEKMRWRTNRLGPDDPIFPNEHGNHYRSSAILESFIKKSLRWTEEKGKPKITMHGFRTMFRCWGVNSDVGKQHLVDIQTDHMEGLGKSKVAQAYGSQNDDWPRRVVMMDAYDQFVTGPAAKPTAQTAPDDDNVVLFPVTVAK